jgi:alkyl hydroperoxide reductase subunit AhpF
VGLARRPDGAWRRRLVKQLDFARGGPGTQPAERGVGVDGHHRVIVAGGNWHNARRFRPRNLGPHHRAAHGAATGDRLTPYVLELDDGTHVRSLPLGNIDRFEGCGVHYAATALESELCEGDDVAVVGGGNSAGQAAVFLSRLANHVHILVRGDGLASSMSDYLIRRIEAAPARITVHPHTEITALDGERHLDTVTWCDRVTGQS